MACPTVRDARVRKAAPFLAAAILSLATPAMAQGLAVNPSAAASDIRNPSSIVPGAAASDIRNPSATNPAAAASEIRPSAIPGGPVVGRRAVAPVPAVRIERRARRPARKPDPAKATARKNPSPRATQVPSAAPSASEIRTGREASGIMGSVCRGC